MIPITQALIAEQQMLGVVFGQIEKLLPNFDRLEEIRQAARMVEGLLLTHAGVEDNLLMLAQDHVPQGKHRYDLCRKEHQEIDSRLTRVRSSRRITQARSLLRAAMAASRKHFQHEERRIFPLIEKGMKLQTLTKLGTVWFLHRYAPANWTI
jgi:hypothetical protein